MQSLAGFLMIYCFPIQLIIGVVGNLLNLMVLLNRRMRSRTNNLLAAVAFADIFFLIAMLPHTLKYNTFVRQIKVLNLFMQYANLHITGLINMCAFASTWLLVTVCFERLLAVRWPLKARTFWGDRLARPSRIICMIWVVAFIVTLHSHITHTVDKVRLNDTGTRQSLQKSVLEASNLFSMSNNDTQGTLAALFAAKPTSSGTPPPRFVLRTQLRPHLFHYWRIATIVHTVLQVFVPVVLVTIMSLLTADALFSVCKLRRLIACIQICVPFQNKKLPSKATQSWENGEPRLYSASPMNSITQSSYHLSNASGSHFPVNQHSSSHPGNQKRATMVVLVIASTFAAFQLPSAIIYIWELIQPDAPNHKIFITAGTLANSLVVTGKMANFFLFCMSSRNFRRNLRRMVCNKQRSAKNSLNGCAQSSHSYHTIAHPCTRQRPESMPTPKTAERKSIFNRRRQRYGKEETLLATPNSVKRHSFDQVPLYSVQKEVESRQNDALQDHIATAGDTILENKWTHDEMTPAPIRRSISSDTEHLVESPAATPTQKRSSLPVNPVGAFVAKRDRRWHLRFENERGTPMLNRMKLPIFSQRIANVSV
ncbi:serpentine type 7TM GPCR chemoreceptor srw domain-containing protein [Ditylenchus destructor]|uniref:Serpentine type 7TM GPCR chemoreceptor srw domain-containing protein n=1 Tax=Ditylenchus destructor TaxID=166010 RepID=A0AAD4RAT3_9BILA|nr:serpentine type 7TM GPCR chemoreceptor srw domain-containing protein [Ditylenchus destructor]